jgi:hypothetical protein
MSIERGHHESTEDDQKTPFAAIGHEHLHLKHTLAFSDCRTEVFSDVRIHADQECTATPDNA